MRHERIIKDKRGTTGIVVKLWCDSNFSDKNGNYFRYDISIWNIPPKKRTQIYQNEDFCEPSEIWGAKMELWNKIKP